MSLKENLTFITSPTLYMSKMSVNQFVLIRPVCFVFETMKSMKSMRGLWGWLSKDRVWCSLSSLVIIVTSVPVCISDYLLWTFDIIIDEMDLNTEWSSPSFIMLYPGTTKTRSNVHIWDFLKMYLFYYCFHIINSIGREHKILLYWPLCVMLCTRYLLI